MAKRTLPRCAPALASPGNASQAARVTSSQEFYRNQLIEQFAHKRATPYGLRQFIFFGRKIDNARLIQSGNFVRTELPIRIAHRIRSLQDLPFVVGMNSNLQTVRQRYLDAFERIRRFPEIKTLEDNQRFCDFMQDRLREHLTVIPALAVGIAESEPEISAGQIDTFMTNMLRSRLSRRVLTEQHLALTAQHKARDYAPYSESAGSSRRFIGVIDTQLDPAALAQRCADLVSDQHEIADRPTIVVECFGDARLAYVPEHLEYMLYELMKNSVRATMERFGATAPDHAVKVSVIPAEQDVVVRISDEGGGIPPLIPLPHAQTAERAAVFSFVHSDVLPTNVAEDRMGPAPAKPRAGKLDALRTISELGGTVREQLMPDAEPSEALSRLHRRLGIGLPLSRIYAEFFGGQLQLFSSTGHGTDAYLRIPKVGGQPVS